MGNASVKTVNAARAALSRTPEVFPRVVGGPVAEATASEIDRTPVNPHAAAVAQEHSAGGSNVSVQRIMHSGPAVGASIHIKNEATVQHLRSLDGAIVDEPDRGIGVQNFKLWQAMQLNPRLLDTADVIRQSNTQLIAAQMAAGFIPASARLDGQHPAMLAPPARRESPSAGPGGALVPLDQASALVPAKGTTVDSLLLRQAPPAGIAAWGPRPAENSPYDQLVLHNPDEEFMLSRNELFELFARHRMDPAVWTPARLAELYSTKPDWVEALLESAAPPIVCTVDGDLYGESSLVVTRSHRLSGL